MGIGAGDFVGGGGKQQLQLRVHTERPRPCATAGGAFDGRCCRRGSQAEAAGPGQGQGQRHAAAAALRRASALLAAGAGAAAADASAGSASSFQAATLRGRGSCQAATHHGPAAGRGAQRPGLRRQAPWSCSRGGGDGPASKARGHQEGAWHLPARRVGTRKVRGTCQHGVWAPGRCVAPASMARGCTPTASGSCPAGWRLPSLGRRVVVRIFGVPTLSCPLHGPSVLLQGTFGWQQMLDALQAGCNTPAAIQRFVSSSQGRAHPAAVATTKSGAVPAVAPPAATGARAGAGGSSSAPASAAQAPAGRSSLLALSQVMKKLKEWVEEGRLVRVGYGRYALAAAAAEGNRCQQPAAATAGEGSSSDAAA